MGLAVTLGLIASVLALALVSLHFLLLLFTPAPVRTLFSEKNYTTTPESSPEPLPKLSAPSSLALSVIVPAYNEDDRLEIMIDEAMEYFSKKGSGSGSGSGLESGVEILVVDDGSTDKTSATARKLVQKWAAAKVEMRVVTLKRNRGKGGAVQHGILHCRGELILFADADGASRFSDLDLLLEAMEKLKDKDGQGMVIGSRAHLVKSEAVVKRSFLRNTLMHGFHLFLRTLGVRGIRDTQCGFKLFTRETARLLFPPLHLPRWSFDVELLLLASLITPTIPVLEIPIAWHEVNGSKIRLGWDSIGMARDLLVLRGNLAVGRWKVPERAKAQ